jgi:hypothetical protein
MHVVSMRSSQIFVLEGCAVHWFGSGLNMIRESSSIFPRSQFV